MTMIPSFLKDIKMSESEYYELHSYISNWLKVYDFVYKQNADEQTIAKLIYIEATTRCRIDIITRLKRRFDKLRKQREEFEILECVKTSLSPIS